MIPLTHGTETEQLTTGIYTMVEEISHRIIFISKFRSLKYNLNTFTLLWTQDYWDWLEVTSRKMMLSQL